MYGLNYGITNRGNSLEYNNNPRVRTMSEGLARRRGGFSPPMGEGGFPKPAPKTPVMGSISTENGIGGGSPLGLSPPTEVKPPSIIPPEITTGVSYGNGEIGKPLSSPLKEVSPVSSRPSGLRMMDPSEEAVWKNTLQPFLANNQISIDMLRRLLQSNGGRI